jgi:hypothetical protein
MLTPIGIIVHSRVNLENALRELRARGETAEEGRRGLGF